MDFPNTNLNHQAHDDEPNTGREEVEQNDDTELLVIDPNPSGDESFGISSLFENNYGVNGENASVNEEGRNDSVNEGGENSSVNEESENTSANEDANDENALVERSASDSVNNDENGNLDDELNHSNENIATGNAMEMLPDEHEFWIDIGPYMKQEVDPMQDDDALVDLLAENEIIHVADDVCMIVGFEGMPTPFVTNVDDMIKRENDPISNDIPFNYTVSLYNYINNIVKNGNI